MIDPPRRRWPPVGLWALTLGVVGFWAGFYGPLALSPDANQGPLLGIFITGPGGVIGGLVLGAVFRSLPISNARRWLALLAANVVFLLGILYFCLPPPETHGHLVKGTLARCQLPAEVGDEGIRYWKDRIAGAPWMEVRDGWQDELPGLIAREPGVVLTIDVQRENRVVQHRKPWNRGRIGAEGWHDKPGTQRYFASFGGAACADYPADLPTLFVPYGQTSAAWPPDDLAGLLHLVRVERTSPPLLDLAE
ncbi:MAG: hypothetical protein AB7G76_11345 [Steroidobacteraceae bacterium]